MLINQFIVKFIFRGLIGLNYKANPMPHQLGMIFRMNISWNFFGFVTRRTVYCRNRQKNRIDVR